MSRSAPNSLMIVGSGHVGLPTAACFANIGYRVYAVDTDQEVVDEINSGLDPIGEPGLKELVMTNVSSGRLIATTNFRQALSESNIVIITVPTPVRSKTPDLSYLMNALRSIASDLRAGCTVIVVSSIPPGTMTTVRRILEEGSKLRAEEDFLLAYVPERIAPGNALRDIAEVPRLVGGVGPRGTKAAAELFSKICARVVPTDAPSAEVSKLAENTFRDVNIAFANELAILCERLGVDSKQVISTANTHPRVSIHNPGGGVGGPCLPKDPWLLVSDKSVAKLNLIVIPGARTTNDNMPNHVLELVQRAIKNSGRENQKCTLCVLGTAYKAGLSDSRLSPSEPLIQELIRRGHTVRAFDPYSQQTFGAQRALDLKDALHGVECMIIMVDHEEVKRIDLTLCKRIMAERPAIVDTKRIIDPQAATGLGFAYYGVGYPSGG